MPSSDGFGGVRLDPAWDSSGATTPLQDELIASSAAFGTAFANYGTDAEATAAGFESVCAHKALKHQVDQEIIYGPPADNQPATLFVTRPTSEFTLEEPQMLTDLETNNAAFLACANDIVNTIGQPESDSPTSTGTVVGILQDLRKCKLVIDSMIVHICIEPAAARLIASPATPVVPSGPNLARTERFLALAKAFHDLAHSILNQIDAQTVMTAWVLRQLPTLQRRCEDNLVATGQV